MVCVCMWFLMLPILSDHCISVHVSSIVPRWNVCSCCFSQWQHPKGQTVRSSSVSLTAAVSGILINSGVVVDFIAVSCGAGLDRSIMFSHVSIWLLSQACFYLCWFQGACLSGLADTPPNTSASIQREWVFFSQFEAWAYCLGAGLQGYIDPCNDDP